MISSAPRVSEAPYGVEGELLRGGFGGWCAHRPFEVGAVARAALGVEGRDE